MSDVFVTTYQVVGAGRAVAEAHFAEFDRIRHTHLDFVKELGAFAYRTGHSGRVYSLYFDSEVAIPGYRQTGDKRMRDGRWIDERTPYRNSKKGKEIQARFDATERLPPDEQLATHFDWDTSRVYPTSGNRVFFPSLCRVDLPQPEFFLRLPRKEDDGWATHPNLIAIPEDRLMNMLSTHNRLAKEAA